MARPRNTSPARPYGRQSKGKTIKSVSIDADVERRIQEEADKRGVSFSELVNGILSGSIKLSLFLLGLFHLARTATGAESILSVESFARSAGKAVAFIASLV